MAIRTSLGPRRTKLSACFAGALMTFMLASAGPSPAQTQNSSQLPTGCIHQSPSGNRFVDDSSRSRADIANDLRNAAANPSVFGAADACLAGTLRNMSAQAYQRLASRSPSTFAPLSASSDKPKAPGFSTAAIQAPPFRFSFTNLDPYIPSGYVPQTFLTVGVTDGNRVLGTIVVDDGTFSNFAVAAYSNGFMKVVAQGYLSASSRGQGNMGGQVNIDPSTFRGQAAIFRDNGVELIPRVAGEIDSMVVAINDLGVAVVRSIDGNFHVSYAIYALGQRRTIDLGVPGPVVTAINNRGTIVGLSTNSGPFRAFRYSLTTGSTQVFEPLPGDIDSWASDINDFDDISGFSFGAAAEHVGVFRSETGQFVTYFTEGTPEVPTIGNVVNVSNSRSPLVLTSYSEGRSYVIPKNGVRIPVAALVDGDPATQGSNFQVSGLSNFNAMAGNTDVVGSFLITPKLAR